MSSLRSWLVGLGVLGLLIAGVAAAGGFEPAKSAPGRDYAPGELIELTRWLVRVDGCEYEPPVEGSSDEFGRARVKLTITNTWQQTQWGINPQTMTVELPNGETFGANGETLTFIDAETNGDFDPQFTRPAIATARLKSPAWTSDGAVVVRLANERQSEGFLVSGGWIADFQVARIEVACPAVSGP